MRTSSGSKTEHLLHHGTSLAFPHRGSSMLGTFREGDILLVAPTTLEAVKPGDVVAIHWSGKGLRVPVVTHRVKKRTEVGLVTQGDHNPTPDSEPVQSRHLVGRVCFLIRDGRNRRVFGGWRGRLRATLLSAWRRVRPFAGWPYRALRRSGIVRRFWRPRLEQVHLETNEGPLVKYVHRHKVVARWWPGRRHLWCRKPYDLILRLPGGAGVGGKGIPVQSNQRS
jgi:hypothetical protein